MKRSLVITLVVLLAMALLASLATAGATATAAAPAPEKSVEKELAKLKALAAGKKKADSFRFIVLSDVHTPPHTPAGQTPPEQLANFSNLVEEINLLKPDFVIGTGDLIHGYAKPETLNEEWDTYLGIVANSKQPFLSVEGNHDIFDKPAEQVWQERMGPLYYSFDYAGSHFICLDSVESQNWPDDGPQTIGAGQLAWLKADLEAHKKAKNIFVFMHKPYFVEDRAAASNWPEVHKLLRQYPTRVVFAGHYHQYRKYDTVDGIEQVINSTSGSDTGNTPQIGDFRDYLLVEVNGAKVDWLVIRPGSIFSSDLIDQALYRELEASQKQITFSPQIEPFAYAKPPQSITVTVENPSAAEVDSEITWQMPNPAWRITPQSAPIKIAANGKASAQFNLQLTDARWTAGMLPRATVNMLLRQGTRRMPVDTELTRAADAMDCPRAPAMKIDGKLSEWKTARAVMVRPEEADNWNPDNFYGGIRVMWDGKWLYIAGEIQDDKAIDANPTNDNAPGDMLGVGIAGKDYRLGMQGGKGVIYLGGNDGYKPYPAAQIAATHKGNVTVYEAALPLSVIFKDAPKVGDKVEIGVYASDQDGPAGAAWMGTATTAMMK